ncbi:MAG TPA: cytochrome c3 family protein [Dongiaceae bacterium]|nr:cytochrome c3 family protein [Dongiaceae bacterium]
MRARGCILAASLLVAAALPLAAVEHPGIVQTGAACTSCHAAKITGKSVHSVMATSCEVCHVTETQGDMMLVSLSMPKQKICYACHQDSPTLRQHIPAASKSQCVDCHDAHSSQQRMLLRVDVATLAPARK